MDGRIVDHYSWSAALGGWTSSFFVAAYFYFFELSAADLRAIYVDGLAAVYIPIALFIFAIPGAIVGVIVQFLFERKRRSPR